MKLISVFVVLAMLVMVMEGCARDPEDTQTVGQRLDRALDKANLAIIEVGDDLGSRVDNANVSVATIAASISDTALLTTLAITDSAVTASIKTDLIKDPDLRAMKIDVETRDGVVSLNGLAYDEESRARAARIAQSNKGVFQVNNHLTVKSF